MSAILEPIEFDYFDTVTREAHTVSISAQRVAMADGMPSDPVTPPETRLHRAWSVAGLLIAFLGGLVAVARAGSRGRPDCAGCRGSIRWREGFDAPPLPAI